MKNQVAPLYFDMNELSELNIGIFGYINEILASCAEDTALITSMLFKEQFPVIAEKPESLYLAAALFQLSDLFATPASTNFIILLNEDSIIQHATTISLNTYELNIDSNMDINIEDKHFMLDYDIKILCKETSTGYIYNTYYIIDKDNSLSTIRNPYIKSVIHTHTNGQRYLGLYVTLHQVNKKTISDTLITNDKINVVSKEYTFDGQIANFEIYYQESADAPVQQLKKLPANTPRIKEPFCFYRFGDDNKLIIEFSNDERFFIPKFNSLIDIDIYTTLGAGGNFAEYTGPEVEIVGKSTKYSSNKGLIFIGVVQGASIGGFDKKSLEEFRTEIIKAWSTVNSFTTANDLTLYFNSLKINELNDLLIIKQRDDALIRLFSAFILFRDADGNIIPTNTIDMKMFPDEIDTKYEQSNRYILKAGKIYKYDADNRIYVKQDKALTLKSNFDEYEGKEFVYVNPFLTVIGQQPNNIGFYLNTIDDKVTIDYSDVNSNTIYQFIVNTIEVYRDGMNGDDTYTITLKLIPTAKLPVECFDLVTEDMLLDEGAKTFVNPTDGLTYRDNGLIKAIAVIVDPSSGATENYFDFELTGFDESAYFLTCKAQTTDYINLNNQIEMKTGIKKTHTGEDGGGHVMVESYGAGVEIYTFYKLPEKKYSHKFDDNPELQPFTVTNKYVINENSSLNFVIPVPEIVSTLSYIKDETEAGYHYDASKVPLVKANYLNKPENVEYFLNIFNNIYKYIKLSMELLVNNFDINIKFFNTYGYSQHFFIPAAKFEGNDTLINRVNIKIEYSVKFTVNTDIDKGVADIKDYIRNYVESGKISLISKPYLSISNLTTELKNTFQNISYLIFKGIDDYGESVQYIESEITEDNVIQGDLSTYDIIPEYLNIDTLIKEKTKTLQVQINVI